jgi:hypothetical protein
MSERQESPYDITHFVEKLRMRVVVLPAPGIPQFDEILLPTLDQREPSAGDARYWVFATAGRCWRVYR